MSAKTTNEARELPPVAGSAEYKPVHGGRCEARMMSSAEIIALSLLQKQILAMQRAKNPAYFMGGSIRANDRRIRNAGGGPC